MHRSVTLLQRLPTEARAFLTLVNAGVLRPDRPDRLFAIYRAWERYGVIGATLPVAALRHGDRPGLIDELGSLTFAQLDERSNAVANALRARQIGPGAGVAILCRNHRGIYDASYGAVKAGARALYLNTDFAGPQAAEVCAREGVDALIYDEEFTDVVAGVPAPKGRFVAWEEGDRRSGNNPSLESLIAAGETGPPPPPESPGAIVILTSGTTGTPKGANRSEPAVAGCRGGHPVPDPAASDGLGVRGSASAPRLGPGHVNHGHQPRLDGRGQPTF